MNSTADSDSDEEYLNLNPRLFKELEKDDDQLMYQMREKRMMSLKKDQKEGRDSWEIWRIFDLEEGKGIDADDNLNGKDAHSFRTQGFQEMFNYGQASRGILDLMNTLARKHKNTRFVKVDVEDVPFLVERMEIKVLPCLVMFIAGVGVDRLLGFEGVSEKDGFSTFMLEKRLALSKVLDLEPIKGSILGFAKSEQSDDEWDE